MDSAILRIVNDAVGTAIGENLLFHRGILKEADLQSNPVMQAVAAQMMQMPPENMPMLASLYAQKLEQDLREDLQGEEEMSQEETDPLRMENRRLHEMVENLRTKAELIEKQKELGRLQGELAAAQEMAPNPAIAAAGGGLPPGAGGIPPEVAAAAQQQQMAGGMAPEMAPPMPGAEAGVPVQTPGPQGVGPVEAAAI